MLMLPKAGLGDLGDLGGGFENGGRFFQSVSFGVQRRVYNCCAGSGWAAKFLDRSGSGGGFEGGEGAIRQFRTTI